MKKLKIKHEFVISILGLSAVILLLINATSGKAQNAWSSSQVKGAKVLFECKKSGEAIFIKNSKYTETTKTRKEYDFDSNEYSYVRLISQRSILEVFKGAFDIKRISFLSKTNESVDISISVDEKGQLINIRFSLSIGTSITPCEIEALENLLVNRVKFDIIGKRISEPIFYGVYIRVRFSEVEKGEIRMARNLENMKAPNTNN